MATGAAATRPKNVGTYFGVSLPVWVLIFLAAGLAVGLLFPKNSLAAAAYVSGTWFPKAVVTFAGPLIFGLLAAATAKLVLLHGRRARRLFGLIVALYLALGVASLIFVTVLIPFLTKLPFVVSDAGVIGSRRVVRAIRAPLSLSSSPRSRSFSLCLAPCSSDICPPSCRRCAASPAA